jgi:hypothetical protein
VAYKFVDEQAQKVLLLFRLLAQQCEEKANSLGTNVGERVVRESLYDLMSEKASEV